MQLSYNVIKNNSVKSIGAKEIVTDSQTKIIELRPAAGSESQSSAGVENENAAVINIESYEKLTKFMVENARRQSESILSKAYEEAKLIHEEALSKAEQLKSEAFEQGFLEGQQEGYNKAYYETMEKAQKEAEAMIASAEALLQDAKRQYEEYLQAKSEDIKSLVFTIAKTVLKNEVKDSSTVKAMIFSALEASKNARNFIIRCNSLHVEELKAEILNWQEQLGFQGEIFVVKDDCLEPGNAVIDKGNGKVVVGVDIALQKISDILEGKD